MVETMRSFSSLFPFLFIIGAILTIISIVKTTSETASYFQKKASKKSFRKMAEYYSASDEYENYLVCGLDADKAFGEAIKLKTHTEKMKKDDPAYVLTKGLVAKYPSLAAKWRTLNEDEIKNIRYYHFCGYEFGFSKVTRNGDSATINWIMTSPGKNSDVVDLFATEEEL